MWLDKVSKVYIVNLEKRTDRLLDTVKWLDEYEIPFQVFTAIEDKEKGARGLRDTMNLLLQEIIDNGYHHTLVLEDDATPLEGKDTFHLTLSAAFDQLPENYHLLYLGGQATGGYPYFYSSNLLPVQEYYATQSVIYSLSGAKEIIARNMDFPIDNWIVKELQPDKRCFAIHPILCTQRAGISDIYNDYVDWRPFIEQRHYQRVAEIKPTR